MAQHYLVSVVAACVLLTGCATVGVSPTQTDSTPQRHSYPGPPSNLSNATVTDVAIEYEEVRLHNRLRNDSAIASFDIGYLYPPNATVVNRSDGGVYVTVEIHYSYGTGEKSADGVPVRSMYYVSETAIRRVAELD